MKIFQELRQVEGKLLEKHGNSFSEIMIIAKEVLLLLQERKQLQDQINEFRSYFLENNPKREIVFNVITQRMMSESSDGCIPQRRRRLERGKVGVLQSW